jgi:transcriptional regulator with XRE-family HTH domain
MTMLFFVTCIMAGKKEHIGQKIKRIRAFQGINQEELARRIGRTRSLISHFERTGNVNKYTLQEIAQALGLPLDDLDHTLREISPAYQTSPGTASLRNSGKKQPSPTRYNENPVLNQQLRQEIVFLKETINHQWQLLHEMAKKH